MPNANSCRLVLPMMIAPASRRRVTTGASAERVPRRHRRPGGRRCAGDVDEILDRDRDAVQRPAVVSGGDFRSARSRLGQRRCPHHGDEGVQLRSRIDPIEALAGTRSTGDIGAAISGCAATTCRLRQRRRSWLERARDRCRRSASRSAAIERASLSSSGFNSASPRRSASSHAGFQPGVDVMVGS